jgi:S-(hydroxymethyl)glutathione dehydrogenase/alcohol dehydrogenase
VKMTAAVLEECGKPLQLLDLEIPKLKRGQVLVKIAYSAICRSQLMEINGFRGSDPWLPHLLGHEASGIVVDAGAGVTKVKPGDEVILTWIKSSGIESDPPQYSHNGRIINAGPITTFSNYSVVSENRVVLKPVELDFDAAVLFGCALATGSGMVLNEAGITVNDTVVVLGLGGVGVGALLTLLARRVKKIVAFDTALQRCEFARALGVTAIHLTDRDLVASTLKSLLPDGADYCIEAGGSKESIELGFEMINPSHGRLIFASHPPTGEKICLDPHQLIAGKTVTGSWGGATEPDNDFPVLANLFLKAEVSLSELVKTKYFLWDINRALQDFTHGKIFRAILIMEHG